MVEVELGLELVGYMIDIRVLAGGSVDSVE